MPLLHAKRCPYTHAQMHAGVTHTHAHTATTEGAVYETPSCKISSQGLSNFAPLTVKPLGIYNPTPPLAMWPDVSSTSLCPGSYLHGAYNAPLGTEFLRGPTSTLPWSRALLCAAGSAALAVTRTFAMATFLPPALLVVSIVAACAAVTSTAGCLSPRKARKRGNQDTLGY